MNILSNFFTEHLAIDLGTVNTVIYAPGRGVVLNEPSALALDKYTGEVISVGEPALKLLGREPQDTEVHRPIRGGTIDNFEVTQKLLKSFITRAHNGHQARRTHVIIGVPGSATPLERRSVRDAAHDVCAGRVDLIDEGLAAALGTGLVSEDEKGRLLVDIGGGTTNIAVVASGGVVSSMSLLAGGKAMDEAIRDYLCVRYSIQVGERTAERVKIEMGAACEQAEQPVKKMEVVGKNTVKGDAWPAEVSSADVRTAIEPVLTEISSAVRRVIEDCKPEVTADIYYAGIILTGGGALLNGMAQRLGKDLRLKVTVPEDPLVSVALGAGKLLEDRAKLQRAAIRSNIPAWEEAEELVVNW